MALQLPAGEPEAGPWRAELLSTIIEEFAGPGRAGRGRPVILAVDGRSNGGKTTLAARIAKASPGSAVVHTDDIAWAALSRFGWADLLIEAILAPVHRAGRSVTARRNGPRKAGKDRSRFPSAARCLLSRGTAPGAGKWRT